MEKNTITANEMKLGDVVTMKLGDEGDNSIMPFGHATVINITAEKVTLFRPYVSTSDFSYTGGLIPYIGIEQYDILLSSPLNYYVIRAGGKYR